MKTTPLWMPSAKTVENSRMAQFMTEINAAHRLNCRSYSNLHAFFAARTLSGRKHGIFWALLARGDGPVATKGKRFEDGRLLGT